jgi:hypothetical protein
MGKQTSVIKFTGRIGNLIGYRRNGVHYVRSMPDKVRQSSATRRAARNFGIASRKGKLIRRALLPQLNMRYDGTLVNRLNKALIQAGYTNPDALQGFRFNSHTGLEKIFAQAPVFLPEEGVLKLPAQELLPLGPATHLEIRLVAARVDFKERRIIHVQTALETVNLEEGFNGMELSVPITGKGSLILVIQARGCTGTNGKILPLGNRRYMAADIVSVLTPALPVLKPVKGKGVRKRLQYREPVSDRDICRKDIFAPVYAYQLE